MLKKVVLAKIIDKAKDHIVEEYQDEFISYIQSDELKEELATKINKKLNSPNIIVIILAIIALLVASKGFGILYLLK